MGKRAIWQGAGFYQLTIINAAKVNEIENINYPQMISKVYGITFIIHKVLTKMMLLVL